MTNTDFYNHHWNKLSVVEFEDVAYRVISVDFELAKIGIKIEYQKKLYTVYVEINKLKIIK